MNRPQSAKAVEAAIRRREMRTTLELIQRREKEVWNHKGAMLHQKLAELAGSASLGVVMCLEHLTALDELAK
jgi:hypothetical protein